jgi:hypothetical protein
MQISEVSVKVCFVGPPRQSVRGFGARNERLERLPADQLQLALEDLEASLAKTEAAEPMRGCNPGSSSWMGDFPVRTSSEGCALRKQPNASVVTWTRCALRSRS